MHGLKNLAPVLPLLALAAADPIPAAMPAPVAAPEPEPQVTICVGGSCSNGGNLGGGNLGGLLNGIGQGIGNVVNGGNNGNNGGRPNNGGQNWGNNGGNWNNGGNQNQNRPPPSQTTIWQQPQQPQNTGRPRWTAPANWGPRGSSTTVAGGVTTVWGSWGGQQQQPSTVKTVTVTQGGSKPPASITSPSSSRQTGVITTRPDYCTNTNLICTTTIKPPGEPVPFKVVCGNTLFLENDINNALNTGCFYAKNGTTVGGSEYPKKFANNERFDFGPFIKGDLYEMPLIGSAGYAGGPVGPDRVIFSVPDCYMAGEVTQTGGTGGRYVACTEEY